MSDALQRDSAAEATAPAARTTLPRARQEDRNGPKRSDIGTILLHWATAATFIVSLLTGIRIDFRLRGAYCGTLVIADPSPR